MQRLYSLRTIGPWPRWITPALVVSLVACGSCGGCTACLRRSSCLLGSMAAYMACSVSYGISGACDAIGCLRRSSSDRLINKNWINQKNLRAPKKVEGLLCLRDRLGLYCLRFRWLLYCRFELYKQTIKPRHSRLLSQVGYCIPFHELLTGLDSILE